MTEGIDDDQENAYMSEPDELRSSNMIQTNFETHEGEKKKRRRIRKPEERVPRKKTNVINCEHAEKNHYAKGMCQMCYHKKGRAKMADCHPDKTLYARNLCRNCYMNNYLKEKRRTDKQIRKTQEFTDKIVIQISSSKDDTKSEEIPGK